MTKTKYDNDEIYADYSYSDETGPSDPLSTWNGIDSYTRTFNYRVPRRLLERAHRSRNYIEVSAWLDVHQDTEGVWR